LKALSFVIHSNILIALAALALALATQVQLGTNPGLHPYLAAIFLATLLDYNLHRYLTIFNPEAAKSDKFKWAREHLSLIKILIISSFAALGVVLLFVQTKILFLLVPLAMLSFLYSFPFPGKQKRNFPLLKIPGMKTFLIALVWTGATVLVPLFFENKSSDHLQLILLFAERFTFIFGIAIPFDIRDMEADTISALKTIPIVYGEKIALTVSNIALLLSLSIATFHYVNANMLFILPAFIFSIAITLLFINNKTIKGLQFYYHGILDGSIVLHGMGIFVSFFLTRQ
jgi:4-hydroxybenzoate polyprenyltransferase